MNHRIADSVIGVRRTQRSQHPRASQNEPGAARVDERSQSARQLHQRLQPGAHRVLDDAVTKIMTV